ncbi:hypothetical protein ACF09J_34390 [Streptomyces sp. NPDC014889]|uniref:hypothetical protein n=1 Tax=Streptomyces sp. NPDC014889 TaxID=3364928 RepID=UPI0036FC99C7
MTVELVDLPGALHPAAQQHRDALLRESLPAASAGDLPSVPLEDLLTAHDTNHLISARLASASELRTRGDLHTVRVQIPADAHEAVLTLDGMLDAANEAARMGRLLTRPALPQIRAASRWLLGQITDQLAGQPPPHCLECGAPRAQRYVPRAGPLGSRPVAGEQHPDHRRRRRQPDHRREHGSG